MAERPRKGIGNVLLVWVVGLTLGVLVGALTAMLLLPASGSGQIVGETVTDLLHHKS